MAERKLTTGRYRRLAQVSGAAAGQVARGAGTRAANMVRSEEQARAARGRRELETAEQLVTVLGQMKGAAMKLGQMLSVLDVGLVGEEHRAEFQAKLAALRDTAPTVPFKQMRKVIEGELGRIGDTFAEFDEEPIAAASIGQVYRAELHDGRVVAVKVQYPRVAAAVRADMQNLGLILRLVGRMAPQLDTAALAKELREEIFEELDYELEASNQQALGRIYAGHPFIVIPAVMSEHCGERVMVTELIEGESFAALERASQEERDRAGEIIFRFYFGSMYLHGMFSGDPHPGNLLLCADGKLAFLDFGLFKRIGGESVEYLLSVLQAVVDGDEAELYARMASGGFISEESRIAPSDLMAYMVDAYWWCAKADHELTITSEMTARMVRDYLGPGATHFATTRQLSLNNPEHILGRRLELLVLAVLGQLGARANWYRIARERIYDDPPTTDLGRAEAEFFNLESSPRP